MLQVVVFTLVDYIKDEFRNVTCFSIKILCEMPPVGIDQRHLWFMSNDIYLVYELSVMVHWSFSSGSKPSMLSKFHNASSNNIFVPLPI